MKVNVTTKGLLIASALTACLAGVLLIVGVFVGTLVSRNAVAVNELGTHSPMKLVAEAASRGKNVSLATGIIDNRREGLYILDHINGNLQCWLLNTRTGEIGGVFRTNVLEAMQGVKVSGDLDFVMTTGRFDFNNQGNLIPAQSIVYVAEGKSGAVVGFGFRFDKAALQRGGVQEGVLEVICKGPIRDLQLREQ